MSAMAEEPRIASYLLVIGGIKDAGLIAGLRCVHLCSFSPIVSALYDNVR
jgi:hypothetical protein